MRDFICHADMPPSDPFACLICGETSAVEVKCTTFGCAREGKPMVERPAATDIDRLRLCRMLAQFRRGASQ